MSRLSSHEVEIQLSLVARIRRTAQQYKSAPAGCDSAALQAYIAALECLAQHIETRCEAKRFVRPIPIAVHGSRSHHSMKSASAPRVIPFPTASPITAA